MFVDGKSKLDDSSGHCLKERNKEKAAHLLEHAQYMHNHVSDSGEPLVLISHYTQISETDPIIHVQLSGSL
jgi:hypothetical protein